MLARESSAVDFDGFFTASKVGKTGLTVTVDVWDPSGTKVVNAASATEVGDGLYTYSLTGTDTASPGNYRAVFKTTDATVDFQQIPALWIVGRDWTQHLDADVSTRLATSGYTAPDNSDITAIKAKTDLIPAAGPPDAAHYTNARGDLLANLDAAISTLPSASAITTAVWAAATRTLTAVSDSSGVTTLLGRLTATRAGLLDNLDAAISTRLATSDYTAPANSDIAAIKAVTDELPDGGALTSLATAASLATVDTNLDAVKAKTDNLPADPASETDVESAISDSESTLAALIGALPSAAGITSAVWAAATRTLTAASDSAGITTLLSRLTSDRATGLDHLDTDISAIPGLVWDEDLSGHATAGTAGETLTEASAPTATEVAGAVWDEALAGHEDTGSAGQALAAAGGASDPLLNTVPGSYDAGTAGAALGGIPDIKTKTDLIPAAGPPDAAHYTNARGDKLDDLDATVSSRSTYAGADTAGTTTLLSRLTDTRAGLLDNLSNLDAAISGLPSASTIATAVWAAGTRTLSTVTAIVNGVWDELLSSHTTTGSAAADLTAAAAGGDAPTVEEIVDGVWDEPISGHQTTGTAGKALTSAGSAGDPWSTDLTLGDYTGDEAGAVLLGIQGGLAGTKVTVVSPVTQTGAIAITQGDDYRTIDGLALQWALEGWTAAATVEFEMVSTADGTLFTKTGSLAVADGNATVTVELTADETATLETGSYRYAVKLTITSDSHITTRIAGSAIVKARP